MKILQVIQKPQLRGAEIFACQLSNCFLDLNHDVRVVSIMNGSAELPFRGPITRLNRTGASRFLDLKGWKLLADLINEFQPDVVQANAGDTLKYLVFSRLFYGWKTPIVFRNASTISLYIKNPVVKAFNGFLFRSVSKVISVSEASRADFIGLFPEMSDRIEVIPIGVDPAVVHQAPSVDEFGPYIIHIGGFTFEKNHQGLIRVVTPVLKKHQEWKLLLVGDGPLKRETEQMVQQSGLGEQVVFLGFRKDAIALLRQARVLVLPSIIEGLPGVILEAMFCEVPVVAYNVGGISEVVIPDKTGWLVQAADESAFTSAVQEALHDETKRQSCITFAKSLVSEHYALQKIAQKFLKAYEFLLSDRN